MAIAPNRSHRNSIRHIFGVIAPRIAHASGSPATFGIAVILVIGWIATGPLFAFSDTWQLVANTVTSVVTFLMVFLIQNSQDRDSAAIQVKLDEIIRAGSAANSVIGVEHLTQAEVEEIRARLERRAAQLKQNG